MITWTDESSAPLTLVAAKPQPDPSGGDLMIWTLDFSTSIEEGEVAKAEGDFPALGKYLTKAVDGKVSTQIKVSPRDRAIRLAVEAGDAWQQDLFDAEKTDTGTIIPEHNAEMSFVKSRLTESVQIQQCRVIVSGVPVAFSTRICRAIGKEVKVRVTIDQQSLPLATAAKPGQGKLCVGRTKEGREVAGLFDGEVGDFYAVDDFSVKTIIVDTGAVLTVETNSEEKTVSSLVKSYRAKAGRRKVDPTWAALIEGNAIAANDGNAPAPGTTTLWLNEAVIDAALALQESRLPPEAGA